MRSLSLTRSSAAPATRERALRRSAAATARAGTSSMSDGHDRRRRRRCPRSARRARPRSSPPAPGSSRSTPVVDVRRPSRRSTSRNAVRARVQQHAARCAPRASGRISAATTRNAALDDVARARPVERGAQRAAAVDGERVARRARPARRRRAAGARCGRGWARARAPSCAPSACRPASRTAVFTCALGDRQVARSMPRERAALDGQRRPAVGGLDARAHRAQRRRHALHGPAAQRRVARRGRSGTAARPATPGQHAQGRARVAGVEGAGAARARPPGPRPAIVTLGPVARARRRPSAARQRRVDCAVGGGGEVADRASRPSARAPRMASRWEMRLVARRGRSGRETRETRSRGARTRADAYHSTARDRSAPSDHPSMTNDASRAPSGSTSPAGSTCWRWCRPCSPTLAALVGLRRGRRPLHERGRARVGRERDQARQPRRRGEARHGRLRDRSPARWRSRCRTRGRASTSGACPIPSPRRTC